VKDRLPLSEKILIYQAKEKQKRLTFYGTVAALVLLSGSAFAGWSYYKNTPDSTISADKQNEDANTNQPLVETTPVKPPENSGKPSETPKPAEAYDRNILKVEILNGTGKAGKATEASGKLQELGYKNTATGDASHSKYTVLNLGVKSGDENLIAFVTKDLKKLYPNVQIDPLDDLAANSEYDIQIIIGAW